MEVNSAKSNKKETCIKEEKELSKHEATVSMSKERSLWVSLGSEKEIEGEHIHASRDQIFVRASRKCKEFGSQYSFSDREAMETFSSGQMECRPFNDPSYDKAISERDVGIQSIPSIQDKASQTMQEVPRNNCVQYQPRELEAAKQKHILATEHISSFLKSTKTIYTDALQQNEVMDIFEDDFSSFGEEDDQIGPKSVNVVTEYQSFSDLTFSKGKMISAIDWMPGKQGVLAAACCESKPFDERLQSAGKPSDSYVLIWSFVDPIHPQIMLESHSDVCSLCFNPLNPLCIAGGCYSGQVILWDISFAQEQMEKKSKDVLKKYDKSKEKDKDHKTPIVVCSLLSLPERSHNALVSDLLWLPDGLQLDTSGRIVKGHTGKVNTLLSVASDGKVIFWDITCKRHEYIDTNDENVNEAASEKYKWCPMLKIDLVYGYCQRLVGPLNMAFSYNSHYFCGTEFGEVCFGDLSKSSSIKHISESQFGQVRTLQRSPFFEDIILSVDVWTFALWKEDYLKPVYISRSADGYLTTGCWSPSRPGVIYIGHIDGSIEVWDLLDHSHQSTTTVSIGSCQVTAMEFWNQTCEAL